MLKEFKVTTMIKWDQCQKMCGDDERYLAVGQIKERKRLFFEYIQDLKKKEREEQKRQLDKEKDAFYKMFIFKKFYYQIYMLIQARGIKIDQ